MKIVHTSDWHIGHKLHERSREEEHKRFFDWLKAFIVENGVELLLVSGDIFDTSTPSNSSLRLYYNFLISLRDTECKSIVVTAGNHDSPATLEAPKEVLNALNIYVVGRGSSIIPIENRNIWVVAVPFLRDRDIRSAIGGETSHDINQRYKTALVNHYKKLAQECEEISESGIFIAMGHLFAINTVISESESTIYIGSLGDISAQDFPKTFDYVALGHLHKAQRVGEREHIRYSGSPIPLSFNEAKRDSKIVLLDIEDGIQAIDEITVPKFRDIISIRGTNSEIRAKLRTIKPKSKLKTWVELIYTEEQTNSSIERSNFEILRVSIEKNREFKYIEDREVSLTSLTPEEIFKKKCVEEGFNLEENIEIKDIFYGILSEIREEEL